MQIIIDGIPLLDGEYPLDIEGQPLTNRELHTIKEIAGVRAGEFDEALAAKDNDLAVALGMIALRRAGKELRNADPLWDAAIGAITVDFGDEEDDALPPPSASEDSPASAHENTGSSLQSSTRSSESSESGPNPTGQPGSVTGADSGPATSAT